MKALLTSGSLAFLCLIFLLLIQDIHPAPSKLTLQKDGAELVRLETQLRVGDSDTEARSLPPVAAANAGTGRVDVQPEKHSEANASREPPEFSRPEKEGRLWRGAPEAV